MARKKQRIVKHDMGPEPSVLPTNQSDLIRAYQWYNYEYTIKQGRKFVVAYLKNRKRDLALFNSLSDKEVETTLCWQARMAALDILPEASRENFENRLKAHLDRAKTAKKPKKVVAETPKVTVQDRIKMQVSSWIADIDDEIDKLGATVKTEFNPYEFLQTVEAKPVHINPMLAYYRPILDEVQEALVGKDDQLKEGYSYLTKPALKRLVAFYETLIGDLERVINNKKAVRKPRKRKSKTADQLVKTVKYLSESKDYKLVSVSPEKLIGASQVWLFNVKYNSLSVYNALDGGFTVQGTTLKNFDPDTSISKRVRKPQDALNAVQKSGKVALRKLMDTFNTKATEGKGRINKDTLIVRVL